MSGEVIAKDGVGDERERGSREEGEVGKVGGYRLALRVADETTEKVGPHVVGARKMNCAHVEVIERADEGDAAAELHELRRLRCARGDDGDRDGVVAGEQDALPRPLRGEVKTRELDGLKLEDVDMKVAQARRPEAETKGVAAVEAESGE